MREGEIARATSSSERSAPPSSPAADNVRTFVGDEVGRVSVAGVAFERRLLGLTAILRVSCLLMNVQRALRSRKGGNWRPRGILLMSKARLPAKWRENETASFTHAWRN